MNINFNLKIGFKVGNEAFPFEANQGISYGQFRILACKGKEARRCTCPGNETKFSFKEKKKLFDFQIIKCIEKHKTFLKFNYLLK